ncbi:MAG TPA: ComEC/Rec2 family competence protein [Allosphingosinicella sp.]|nr:ComEC/Rec2 family competence protein [Allosphingosinicella sp.]
MATAGANRADEGNLPVAKAPGPSLVEKVAAIGRWLESLADQERDQFPLWLPVGLILGVSAWFWLPDTAAWTAFLLLTIAAGLGALALLGWSRWGRGLALFSLAAAFGCGLVWWKSHEVAAPRLERPRVVEFTGRIESVQTLAAEEKVRLVVAPQGEGLPALLRLNLDEDRADPNFVAGATVRARGWLMPPAPMAAPGGYDFSRTAWFQRIGGSGRVAEISLVAAAPAQGWRARLAGWREDLAAHIRGRLGDGAEGGIAAALATGDQHGINEAEAEAMRRSGLAHLLSVSGLHLTALVGAVVLLTLKLLALSPRLALRFRLVLVAALVGALAGIGYTLLTGAEVPTVRACIASLLVLGGIALGRDAITLRLVAVGALIVVLLWPESVAGPSFQMSFAAIVAIVALHESPRIQRLFSRRDEGLPSRLARAVFALVLTGLAVELALTPIALFHFHQAGLYGAFANVVAIPLTTFIVMPLEALALLFDLVGLGAPFWWVTGKALSLLLWIAHVAAAAPGAVALLPAIPVAAFALMVAGGLWICLWRTNLRRFGVFPVAAGAVWAFATPAPDLIVTGDGRHFVLRTNSGELALLRPKAGDYVRDTLAELAGAEPNYLELESLPVAACSADLCAANLVSGDRAWRILATRSPHFVRWDRMVEACAEADIVISERWLPRACVPRWLKIDRGMLRRTGGLSITLGERPRVETVADQTGRHPWAQTMPLPPADGSVISSPASTPSKSWSR